PQGFEIYNGSPIVYSTGNFLFDTPYTGQAYREDDLWWKGYMAVLVIKDRGKTNLEIIPVESGPGGTKVARLNRRKTVEFLAYLRYISNIIADREKVLDHWNAWCVQNGPWWVEKLKKFEFPYDMSDRERHMAAMVIRNGQTCEAHRETITTFFKLAAAGHTEGHEAIIEKTRILQRGLIPSE
ncbi:MAG: CapA family protein, partial [Clostridia bacterium]|nr:CapA family protein [Clostridia bacterium]